MTEIKNKWLIPSTSNDIKQLELSYIVGKNKSGMTILEPIFTFIIKLNIYLPYNSSIQVKWKHACIETCVRIFSCLSYNHLRLGTTDLSFNWWNGLKKTGVHPYSTGILLSNKKEWALIHAATGRNLKGIMLSEISHTQRQWSHYDILEKQLYRDRKAISVGLVGEGGCGGG